MKSSKIDFCYYERIYSNANYFRRKCKETKPELTTTYSEICWDLA